MKSKGRSRRMPEEYVSEYRQLSLALELATLVMLAAIMVVLLTMSPADAAEKPAAAVVSETRAVEDLLSRVYHSEPKPAETGFIEPDTITDDSIAPAGGPYVHDFEENARIDTENAQKSQIVPIEGRIMRETDSKVSTEEPQKIYMGWFQTTGYCNCSRCCGKWAGGPTASGAMPRAQHTVAVDPAVIPLGTRILMNGVEYTAEDTGTGVNGNHIDIYYGDHYTALCHGLQEAEVWILK